MQALWLFVRPKESQFTFNRMPRRSTCTLKFENHSFKRLLALLVFNLFFMKHYIFAIYPNIKKVLIQKKNRKIIENHGLILPTQ